MLKIFDHVIDEVKMARELSKSHGGIQLVERNDESYANSEALCYELMHVCVYVRTYVCVCMYMCV